MHYLFAFLLVFFIVYFIIPLLRKLALKLDFVDKPTERKKHDKPIPLLGGAGIFLGFMAGYVVFIHPVDGTFIPLIIGSLLILGIGMVDDWHKTKRREFPIYPRLFIQLLAAFIIYKSGIVFYGFTNPFNHQYIVLPIALQFFLSIIWIFGVTTVINWCDGLDGLAGSLSAISGSTLFVVALAKGQPDSAMMSIILVAAVLGFLRYNKPPAQIYMGDSGANFLGFMLGIIALDGAFKQTTLVSLSIPILALGVPIFDNMFVIIKRFINGKPIYKADHSQIHYRLQTIGLNTKQVLAVISLISVCLSLVSIIILLLKV